MKTTKNREDKELYKKLKKEILNLMATYSSEYSLRSHYDMSDDNLTINLSLRCKGAKRL